MKHHVQPDGCPAPFAELMHLEKIDERTFRSTMQAYQPGEPLMEGLNRTYGGHVYAQAVWAAAQTVGKGFLVHNVTGFFTLLGVGTIPFVYTVRTVRDGKSYCVRTVEVTQEEAKGICFTCTCSFKLPQKRDIDVQDPLHFGEKYKTVLQGKRPSDHPEQLQMMSQWFRDLPPETRAKAHPVPGLVMRHADLTAYNEHRLPHDRRRLGFYSVVGSMAPAASNPNLHACAHLYASDRNSMFVVTDHLGVNDRVKAMGSLSHTVLFHVDAAGISTLGGDGEPAWFCQESWTDRAADSRGNHRSRMWDASGRHIASTLQDGMVRLQFDDDEELERVRRRLQGGTAKL